MEDISALAGLSALSYADLGENRIRDLSALVANTGLGPFDTLVLRGNPLDAQDTPSQLSALQDRRIALVLDEDPP